MRESKSKNRKTGDNSDGNSPSLLMELDLNAVKAKNVDLIKAHSKLLQENSEMRNQIYTLHSQLMDIQTKYNNLESVLRNLEQNMKKCTPNLIDILNLFLKVSNNNRTSYNILNMTGSDTGFTPKTKAITNAVKPHTVNGTVLNLVPTISIARLNTTSVSPSANQRSPDVSSTSQQGDYRNSLPSTSTSDNINENGNHTPNLDGSGEENQSFVSRRRHTNLESETHLNDVADDIESEQPSSDESEQEEEDIEKLSTIQEESMCSTGRSRTSLGEVRIYLSRLSSADMHVRRSQNTSFSSTEANVNDTCLNIETTVIESQENRGSKRLRADIMVFSPPTNSTRMEIDDEVFDDPSPRDDRRKISGPSVSAIQSNEITPSTSRTNVSGELMPSEKLPWLPTPSLSAMGDIDADNTNLEILTESEKNTEHSPPRKTRSSNKIKMKSKSTNDDESPRSSITTRTTKRSVRSFVNKCKIDNSDDRALTPTIVLERLETLVPPFGHTATSLNIQIVTQSDEPKENENPPKTRQTISKKGKAKIKSKSPKKSIKRKLNDDEEKDTDVLEEKIREIQIRLSNFVPETSGTDAETPEASSGRPKRAARPTSLKDASLKGKLRRMF